MVFRPRQATSGTILCLASAILLALVSFNTPLLRSMYFLKATYSTGEYAGTVTLGTLGYCLELNGVQSCVGPTVGYNFNPNTLFGITTFNIPEAITRYLTYTLILHIIALGCGVAAVILGLFDHISTLSLLCFPTCSAWLTSTCALLALIFDLVIFYIAKARIDAVSGASASIGISVWLTLAAWLCAGLSGCAFPLGKKWGSKKKESGDPRRGGNGGYDDPYGSENMRLRALQDEQARKKEQGLPSFAEVERQPLTAGDGDDKYYYEEPARQQQQYRGQQNGMPGGGLARDGSVLNGVGMGYGRRSPRDGPGYLAAGAGAGALAGAGAVAAAGMYGRSGTPGSVRPPASEYSYAGNAGVGAGGAGVERAQPTQVAGYGEPSQGYYDPNGQWQQYADGSNQYSDPYVNNNNQSYPRSNDDHSYNDHNPTQVYDYARGPSASSPIDPSYLPTAYPSTTYPPTAAIPAPIPTPNSSGFYPNPHDGQRNSAITRGAYDGYDDDENDPGALGAIGLMAQSNGGRQGGDYTGQQQNGYNNSQIYGGGGGAQIVQPRPQHLADHRNTVDMLRHTQSPMSAVESDIGQQQQRGNGYNQYGGSDAGYHGTDAPPPSYVAGGSAVPVVPEKAGYRPGGA